MVIVPCPGQPIAGIFNEIYWPARVCPEETDVNGEVVLQETTSYKEPGNVNSVLPHSQNNNTGLDQRFSI